MVKYNVGDKFRIFLDEVEEWTVVEVKEILQELDLGCRYLLEGSGFVVERYLNETNCKEFGVKPLKKIKGPEDVTWNVLFVPTNNICKSKTIGMEEYIGYEIEVAINLEPDLVRSVINHLCISLVEGEIDIHDGKRLDEFFKAKTLVKKTEDLLIKNKNMVGYRLILSDENNKLPYEEGCNEFFKTQILDC